ncbi:MAG: hypothetical protein WBJ33_03055 [Candidatus Nanopelagicales bacterium]
MSRATLPPRFTSGVGAPRFEPIAPSSAATPNPRVTEPTSNVAFCEPSTELVTATGFPPTSAWAADLSPANISGANLALEGVSGTFTPAEGATTTGAAAAALPPPDAGGVVVVVGAIVVVVGVIMVVVGAIVATFVIGALIALSMLESRDEAALEHP